MSACKSISEKKPTVHQAQRRVVDDAATKRDADSAGCERCGVRGAGGCCNRGSMAYEAQRAGREPVAPWSEDPSICGRVLECLGRRDWSRQAERREDGPFNGRLAGVLHRALDG